jgi:phosphopantetheine adenylyltransferase
MKEKRRDTVKVMENVTNEKLDVLVKGLRKIQDFDFFIDTFILIK